MFSWEYQTARHIRSVVFVTSNTLHTKKLSRTITLNKLDTVPETLDMIGTFPYFVENLYT